MVTSGFDLGDSVLPQPPSEVYPLGASHRSSSKDKKIFPFCKIPSFFPHVNQNWTSHFSKHPFSISSFSSLSDLVEDKLPIRLFVSVSCLLLSSSSHCVVSTLEKRGTKKKRKEKKSLPLLSPQISSDRRVPPRCPSTRVRPVLLRARWISSDRTSPMVKTHGCRQPAAEDCDRERAQSKQVAPLPLWETRGSSSSLAALRMCFGVAVPPFTPCVIQNMLMADQLKRKRLLQTPACTETGWWTGTMSKEPNISLWSEMSHYCEARTTGQRRLLTLKAFGRLLACFFFSKERSKKDQIMFQ